MNCPNKKSEWYLLGARVAAQGKVGNHLLIGKLISLCALDHSIQHQDIPICFTEIRMFTLLEYDLYRLNKVQHQASIST